VKVHAPALLKVLAIAAACLFAGCSDETVDGPSDDKDGGATASDSGLGKLCASNNDCAKYGLSCYITNLRSGVGICSQGCKIQSDCTNGTFCNPLGDVLVCTPPRLCDPCQSSSQCGPNAPECVQPKDGGARFCTFKCNVGDGKCPAGYSCRQYGSKVDEFACHPDYGSCKGDGAHCSPCKTTADCSPAAVCFQSKDDAERYCATTCQAKGGAGQCPTGTTCVSYGGKGYCYKVISSTGRGPPKSLPTCGAGSKGFCDACEENWQCASGRCVTKNGKKFCAQKGNCSKSSEATDCPYGGQATFCVPSDKGNVCAPPPAFHCHGYKACLSHPCGGGEVCDNGLCKKAPK